MPMLTNSKPHPKIRCRQIGDTDMGAVVELLTVGFPARNGEYWQRAFDRMGRRATPDGYPRYGYLLEADGVVVGVILQIFSSLCVDERVRTRCNVSSWYVEPAFRGYASLLIAQALRHKNVTYLNISPSAHTRPIIEAQGFACYSRGQFVAIPALRGGGDDSGIGLLSGEACLGAPLRPGEPELLSEHLGYGCICLCCSTTSDSYPFVFLPRRVKGILPGVQLIYCRRTEDFARFAGPIGRFLARRGRLFVIIDANAPMPGLIGKYTDNKYPKYFRGAQPPHLGDLAHTEAVMFGL